MIIIISITMAYWPRNEYHITIIIIIIIVRSHLAPPQAYGSAFRWR